MSKYLEKIQAGLTAVGKDACLIGSTLLVEVVERERKTASGLILAGTPSGKELSECVVVATGSGYFDDETGEDVPLDTRVGDVVYIDPMHVRRLYSFPVAAYQPMELGLIEESQILMRFRGADAVERFREGTGINGK